MIRTIDSHDVVQNEVAYAEYAGLSTDTKPTKFGVRTRVVNGRKQDYDVALSMGSVFIEVNTGDVYLFNETAGTWSKVGE